MKRAITLDSSLPAHFDPVPARVRWSEAVVAGWSPFRHRFKATVDLSSKGPPCAY
ncbi:MULTISPECIES: hypothetical protein [unclassified Mesorhizobium]|uniref:hypothetical protein n=1 Tax=unclassified Mesorhizobium TaxID=325217 RepID=UPI0015E2E1D0|nr:MULTISPECIES: hypothetical protein [unclassified Mesorhizobium]UCI29611.1 hypothetical protein FJW03_17380 [Mesorhizobium sp. B4-1-4]